METLRLGMTAGLGMLVSALCLGLGCQHEHRASWEQGVICYFCPCVVDPGKQERWEVSRF